jgi:hypothetical protein
MVLGNRTGLEPAQEELECRGVAPSMGEGREACEEDTK